MSIHADGDHGDGFNDTASILSTAATVNELPQSIFGEERAPLEGMSADPEDFAETKDVRGPGKVMEPKKKLYRNGVEVDE